MAKYKKDSSGKYYIDKIIAGKRYHVRGNTCAEVDKKLAEKLAKLEEQKEDKEKGQLFEIVAEEWAEKAIKTLEYSTFRMYRIRLNSLLDEFSGYRMQEITPKDITNFYDKMAAKGYAKKTITHARTVLRDIYDYWNLEYNAAYSPIEFAKIKKGKNSVEREPPPEEAIEAVKANPAGFGILPMLLMYTGLRLSEALGIQVKAIDLNAPIYGCPGRINIVKEVKWYSGGAPYIKEPKTDAGIRVIPVMSAIYPILKAVTESLNPDDYLIGQSPTPIKESTYNRHWTAYCRSIGFAEPYKVPAKRHGKTYMITKWKPTITAHQFRHYMATACFEAKIPDLIAQRIMGHKSIDTTRKVYTHIRDKLLTKNYQALDIALGSL